MVNQGLHGIGGMRPCDRKLAAAPPYLWEATLLLLCSQEETDHPQQLQVGRGHLDPAQRLVEKVDGQVQGVRLETHHVLVGEATRLHLEGRTTLIKTEKIRLKIVKHLAEDSSLKRLFSMSLIQTLF